MHCIEIEKIGQRTYRVWYRGNVILENTADPEMAACRLLYARGFRGLLYSNQLGTGVYSYPMDITMQALKVRIVPGRPPQYEMAARIQVESVTHPFARGPVSVYSGA